MTPNLPKEKMYPERYYTPAKHFIEIQTMNVKTGEN